MRDFLSFNSLITPGLLIFFYYFFAVMIPVLLWMLKEYLLKRFSLFESIYEQTGDLYRSFTLKQRFYSIAFLLFVFFIMELILRMMFEVMIAYFDMHSYLYEITQSLAKGV